MKLITNSLTAILLCLVPSTQAIAQETKQELKQGYPPELANNFVSSCVNAATADGVDTQIAENICKCYLSGIQNEYTYEEFQAINSRVSNGEPLPSEFNQIVNDCISQYVNN